MNSNIKENKTNPELKKTNLNLPKEEVAIEKTEDVKNSKGSVILGKINNGTITPTDNALPNKINPFVKQEEVKVVDKNKKRVNIVTPREKRMRTITSIVMVLALLFCGGAYYYFGVLHDPQNYTIKNVTYNLGETVSTNSSDYVNLPSVDELQYVLDISKVDATTIGNYSYSITYKGEKKYGTISIVDALGPVITPKENIILSLNGTYRIEDFVTSCNDPSECNYDFETTPDLSQEGTFTINIIATDLLGNTSTTEVKYQVGEEAISLICTGPTETDLASNTRYTIIDTIYFNVSDSSFNRLNRSINNIFMSNDSYLDFKEKNQNNPNYKFDDLTYSYSYDNVITTSSNFTNLDTARTYYTNLGYTCN